MSLGAGQIGLQSPNVRPHAKRVQRQHGPPNAIRPAISKHLPAPCAQRGPIAVDPNGLGDEPIADPTFQHHTMEIDKRDEESPRRPHAFEMPQRESLPQGTPVRTLIRCEAVSRSNPTREHRLHSRRDLGHREIEEIARVPRLHGSDDPRMDLFHRCIPRRRSAPERPDPREREERRKQANRETLEDLHDSSGIMGRKSTARPC